MPKYTINSALNWQITHEWDLNTTYTHYCRQKTGSRPTRFIDVYDEDGGSKLKEHELGSYGVFGLNVGYNWKDIVSLRAGVNNLFDKTILRTAGTARTYSELNLNQYSVGSPCRTICTVCGSPSCRDLNLIYYTTNAAAASSSTPAIRFEG